MQSFGQQVLFSVDIRSVTLYLKVQCPMVGLEVRIVSYTTVRVSAGGIRASQGTFF